MDKFITMIDWFKELIFASMGLGYLVFAMGGFGLAVFRLIATYRDLKKDAKQAQGEDADDKAGDVTSGMMKAGVMWVFGLYFVYGAVGMIFADKDNLNDGFKAVFQNIGSKVQDNVNDGTGSSSSSTTNNITIGN